jgi:hypothetical protein
LLKLFSTRSALLDVDDSDLLYRGVYTGNLNSLRYGTYAQLRKDIPSYTFDDFLSGTGKSQDIGKYRRRILRGRQELDGDVLEEKTRAGIDRSKYQAERDRLDTIPSAEGTCCADHGLAEIINGGMKVNDEMPGLLANIESSVLELDELVHNIVRKTEAANKNYTREA